MHRKCRKPMAWFCFTVGARWIRPCVVAALVLSSSLVTGCVSERAEEIATLEGDPDSGAPLFSQHCIRCHGANARSGSADADLVAAFREGEVAAIDEVLEGNFGMPNFGETLNDQEVADIAAYVRSLGG